MTNWEPSDPVHFNGKTVAAVLCVSSAFLALGLILYFYA